VREADIGAAGMKDRHAITRQCLSLPKPATPEAALALKIEGVTILAAARHEHKLRTGHLAGNRFTLTIRELAVAADEATGRASAILARLAKPPGAPNWYGEQRFGMHGDNATRGKALLLGERLTPPPRDGREKRFLVSAYQSELFNRYLERRITDGLYARVITGDVLKKTATGGIFETADPAVDQPRLDAGEIAPTGPMYGGEMRAPSGGTEAAAREATLLAEEHLTIDAFAKQEGTRRPIGVPLVNATASQHGDAAVTLMFSLPSGAYATTVAAEVTKAE
jgi:tRNA pseudouridine13 synthase